MSRGYRCIIFAIVGWLTIAASPEQHSARDNKKQPDQASSQALQDIAAAIKTANEREQPDKGCQAGEDARDSDLCAQWKAADAAKESADWTRRTFWLAVVGTFIGSLTLLAAGLAAKFAKDAAIHTDAGAKEAKRSADAADIGLRNFVDIERARIVAEPRSADAFAEHTQMGVISISNIGRSTASIVQCRSAMLSGVEFPGDFPVSVKIDKVLGASEAFAAKCVPIDTREADNKCFAGGYIEYRSTFGQTHKAYFLARIVFFPSDAVGVAPGYWTMDPSALYCSREDREGRFGWPSDT